MIQFGNSIRSMKNLLGPARLRCIAVIILLAFPLASRAQDTGYISGTVTDKTGAAIAGANVVVSLEGGNLTRATETNTDGAYVVAALPAGTYDIAITAKGFQKYQAKGVVLNVAQKLRVDVALTVGAVTEEVVVTGESVAQVETQSSEVGSTVTGKQVNQLILNGRNFTQLVTLVPGVVNQTGQDEGTVGVYGNVAYSMNGGRTEYNNWEIDGGDNMDNGSNSTLNVYPNLEAIAEFKVLTSNYGAQYGRNGSGTVEIETKSGTNAFHGSAFYYGRNDAFNAKNFFDDPTQPIPPYKKHDWGYTFGGPIYIPNHYNADKKKTFFFWSQEWRREKNPQTFLHNVPSDAERNGDFSDLCPGSDCPNDPATGNPFTNNQVPVDPNAQFLLPLIPKANTTNGGFPAYQASVSTPTTWREELVRVDHNFTDNYRLTIRYIHDSWNTVTPTTLWSTADFPTINTNFTGPGTSFVARLSANITPTLLNEFVFSYTGDHIILTNTGPVKRDPAMTMTGLFPDFGGKVPGIQVSGGAPYGDGFGEDPGFIPWNNANPTYTYRDNMTKIVGNHTMQFGFYLAAAQKNEQNSPDIQGFLTFDNTSAVSTGNAFADLLMGNIASFSQANLQTKYYNRYKIVEPYFQDDWRITKRLTLNLGLRLSLFGTYRERYKQAFSFEPSQFNAANSPAIDVDGSQTGSSGALIPGAGNPFNGIIQCGGKGGTFAVAGFPGASVGGSSNPGCMSGHLFNPAPRIGFAWDPRGDGKMAIRGGYGIFFEHTNGNEGNTESLEGSPPLVLTAQQFNVTGYTNIGGGGLLFPLAVTSIPEKAIWPYVQQWNLGIQKELPSHIVASVAYVGSKGTHLTLQRNLNQVHPVAASENPFAPGQPITSDDCSAFASDGTLENGTPVTGQAAINLDIACGDNPDPLRPLFGYGNITRLENIANSNYNALQATARRTVGDLTLSVAYTYSHSIDDSSDRFDGAFVDSYNIARTRANSNFDQRHNLTFSYVYGLPFFKSASGFTHTALGGWQVSGITTIQSGTPFTVTNGTDFGDNAGVANGVGTGSYPDRVGDPFASPGPRNIPGVIGPLLYNPNAFAIPTGLTFGTAGRNIIPLPRRTNFDFGLFKRFSLGEQRAFEFRWENYNLFNHTQFSGVDSSFGSSTFLHPNSAHRARTMQFGLRFQF